MRTSTAIAAIATTALVATAATATADHLITGNEIAPHTISGQNIQRGAISASHLNGSLQRKIDIHASRGPRGFQGRQGPQGGQGATGAPGIAAVKIVSSPTISIPPGETSFDVAPGTFQATCPAGMTAIGTGYDSVIGEMTEVQIFGGVLVGGFVINNSSITISPVSVQAVCAQLPAGTPVATAARSRAQASWHGDAARLNVIASNR
jgi:hypothetical protein